MLKQSSHLKNFPVSSLVNETFADKQRREKKNHMKKRTHNLFHCILESLYWHLWNPLQNLNIYSASGTISARFLFYFSAGELSYYFVFSHFRFAFAFDSANIKQINIKLNLLGSMTKLSYSFQLLLTGSSCWSCQIAIVNHYQLHNILYQCCVVPCVDRVKAA